MNRRAFMTALGAAVALLTFPFAPGTQKRTGKKLWWPPEGLDRWGIFYSDDQNPTWVRCDEGSGLSWLDLFEQGEIIDYRGEFATAKGRVYDWHKVRILYVVTDKDGIETIGMEVAEEVS